MAGPRAGAEALVMERLVLRESPFPRPWPQAARPATWPGVPHFAPARRLRGDVRL